MKTKKIWSLLTTAAVMFITGSFTLAPAYADTKGEHPHYLHALSDLRYARALLEVKDEENVEREQKKAVHEIDEAIHQINHAAIDDGKELKDHPPIDANLSHRDRFGKVIELLDASIKDLKFEEDDKKALGWRSKAINSVKMAHHLAVKVKDLDKHDDKKEEKREHKKDEMHDHK